ncbi:MAG: curli assembly protein CsgG [Verrucomicrobia bacterium]|nr:curli assembly protein CsgG [Verrucomicrobiota bacterium]
MLDLETTDPKLKETSTHATLLLTAVLSAEEGLVLVERQDLAKVLGEQELGVSGLVSTETAARIGHLTGARVLVTGRLFNVTGETMAALKIMGTETGRVFAQTATFPSGSAPTEAIKKMGDELAKLLRDKKGVLVAKFISREDRVTRLKEKAVGRSLPSLALTIPEQHLGPAVSDPAAETEIGLILREAGFTLLSGAAAESADIRISGEAFSETGIRRGSLISCRARVEVKAVERAGGKIVLMDRQTTVAVDTAEHIAAKLALQRAGAELAERLADALLAAKP